MTARIDYLELPGGKYILVVDNVSNMEVALRVKQGITKAMECDPKFLAALVFQFPVDVASSAPPVTYADTSDYILKNSTAPCTCIFPTAGPCPAHSILNGAGEQLKNEARIWRDKDGVPR